jgi:hypothetical protein
MLFRRAVVAGAVALAAAASAHASIWIATGVQSPAFRVDARGLAWVTWMQHGARQTLAVPPSGKVFHGGTAGADVSKPASTAALPFAVSVRRGADGSSYALQLLPTSSGAPPQLDLAHWRGAPTLLTLTTDGETLRGTATFHGQPVAGFSSTPTGTRLRVYVYLWCLGCPASPSSWTRLIGVAPAADGSFSVALRPEWMGTRYRATLMGPNVGAVREPDAVAFAGP